MLERYSHNPHLAARDNRIFLAMGKNGADWEEYHLRAAEMVNVDLQALGYFPADEYLTVQRNLLDEFETATVTLTFTAAAGGGDITVPAGTRVQTLDPDADNSDAAVVFETDSELTVADGSTGTVAATAENPGRPYNVRAGQLIFLGTDISGIASVTNAAAASGGADNQLTPLTVYAALRLLYFDLMEAEGDGFDYKRRTTEKFYKDELMRRKAAGLAHDLDKDGVEDSESLRNGYVMLERG